MEEQEKINSEEKPVNKRKPKASSKKKKWKSFVGGDMLNSQFLKRQTGLIVLITFLTLLYINNRHHAQQEMIQIDELKKTLTDAKYDALTRSSELMEKSRQSHIEEYITERKIDLKTATEPPFLIK